MAFFTFHQAIDAQINADSPFPVEFLINEPANIAASYSYGTQTGDWGPQLSQTVTGDVIWAYDDTDSLGCGDIVTDLTGKMALIRRGACFFSQKVWNAQASGAIGAIICNHYDDAAQDGNSLVGMSAANEAPWDSLAGEVTIPAVFASRITCEAIVSELDAGTNVNASFSVRSFSNPVVDYSYHTPLDAQLPLGNMGLDFTNLDPDPLATLNIFLEITDPLGNVTNMTQTESLLPSLTPLTITFDDPYTPTEVGEYTYRYTNDLNSEEFEGTFVVTETMFAQDNGNVVDWIANSNDGFVDDGLRYDFGNFYRSGLTDVTATHVTFQLFNATDIYTGDADADQFTIIVYDADPDGDGLVGNPDSYGEFDIVGFGVYSLTGNEQPDQQITVELDDPVPFGANKIYLVMVQYDGSNAGVGIPPWYGYGGNHGVAAGLGSAVFTNRLYVGGWAGGWKGMIRAHLDGFTNSTEPLDQSKVALSPNPATDVVNLELQLDKVADEINLRVLDFTGQLISYQIVKNVQSGTFPVDVSNLAAGTYFLSIETPEGYRAKKFVVIR